VQLAAREIYTLLATVYRQEGLLQKAIEQYDRALKVAGDDGQLLLAYAKMLRQAGRPGEALRALERAEKVGVTDLHLLLLEKARAMERQGMLDQAIEAYESALRITEDGDTWTQLGRLYRATDSTDHSKAMRAFKQAIKCNQYQIEAATYLAESALEQKDEDSALAALDSVRLPDDVRQVSPSVLDNYLEMTNTLMHLVSDRLNKNPTDPAVHHRLGDLYLLHAHLMDNPIDLVRYDLATGDYVRAVLSYEVSLKIDFGQPDLETKVREIYAPLDEERRELERRLSQGETGADVYNRLAMVSWRLARLYGSHETSETRRQAVVLFRRAVEVLDLSIQADLSQREMRRLFAMLAEQLRHMESGG
jgi:tetratricopeptide (TPR) repeat protein